MVLSLLPLALYLGIQIGSVQGGIVPIPGYFCSDLLYLCIQPFHHNLVYLDSYFTVSLSDLYSCTASSPRLDLCSGVIYALISSLSIKLPESE